MTMEVPGSSGSAWAVEDGLRGMLLKTEYRSDRDDLVRDFYVPCLERSVLYRRAVGYFTSRGLAVAAQGIAALIERNGRMLLVASPLFDPDDLEAIRRGYEAREQVVARALVRSLSCRAEAAIEDRLGYLAWLVADGRLEIRVAIPVSDNACPKTGIYHEKLGLLSDKDQHVVAFTGSPNETAGGLVENFEAIDVFCSWDDPQERVARKVANFERLWENRTVGLDVIEFPEAARRQLLTYRPKAPPDLKRRAGSAQDGTHLPSGLWAHQIEAIQAWEKARRRGLVSMATGAGKTRMALAAAERCGGLEFLVIAVPRKGLVLQWTDELRKCTAFPCPIMVHESAANWQDSLFNRVRARSGARGNGPVVVVGTMHSLSGEPFDTVMRDAPPIENALLIADEVHNIGAPTFRRLLRDTFSLRLGLSATPVRHFDEEGTSLIRDYFGGTVYVYDLRRALGDGHLCPYRYFVYAAHLSDEEFEAYEELTRQIARARGQTDDEVTYQSDNALDGDSQEVRMLLFRRARILKRCEAKLEALRRALADHRPRRSLIYCADNEQLELVKNVLDRSGTLHLTYKAETPADQRVETLSALQRGDVPVVLAIDCLDEGVDVPAVDQAIILASSSNKRQFIQRRGRVLRRARGKESATLVDIVALPPRTVGIRARRMLNGELARAKEMADLALNRHEALLQIQQLTSDYGVTLTGLLSGEGDG